MWSTCLTCSRRWVKSPELKNKIIQLIMGVYGHYYLNVHWLQWPRFYFFVKLHSLILVDYCFSTKKSSCKQNLDNSRPTNFKKSENKWDIVFQSKSSQQWRIHFCLSMKRQEKYWNTGILMKGDTSILIYLPHGDTELGDNSACIKKLKKIPLWGKHIEPKYRKTSRQVAKESMWGWRILWEDELVWVSM